MTVEEKVKQLIATQAGEDDSTRISSSQRLNEDLGLDSLDAVEICMGIEDEYQLDIPSDDIEPLKTVGDVIKYTLEHVGK